MKTARNIIPPSVRLKVLIRDGFRCVYCGATKEDDRLEVDHVIPASRGGTDDIGNLVVACRRCNIGKGKSEVVDVTEEDRGVYFQKPVSKNVEKPRKLHAPVPPVVGCCRLPLNIAVDRWCEKFAEKFDAVDRQPPPVTVWVANESRLFQPAFTCRGRAGSDIPGSPCVVHVLVVPWKGVGEYTIDEQESIKRAVVAGYETPTIIVLGTTEAFVAFLIHTRHKGCPRGQMIDTFLEPRLEFDLCGWYPDENDDFMDLRQAFFDDQRQLQFQRWVDCEDGDGEWVGVYYSYDFEGD